MVKVVLLSMHDLLQKIDKLDFLQVFTTDLNGRAMTLQVNPSRAEKLFREGVGFDGSSVAGLATVEDSDRLLIPVADSYRRIDFGDEILGFLIGRVFTELGSRSRADSRAVLEQVVDTAESELGCRFLVGPEHEFFLLTDDEFSPDIHTDKAGYFQADPRDKGDVIRKRITGILSDSGIQYEKAHHEVTASQHEINLEALDPLGAADRTVFFNYITQKVAEEAGYHATFMPKPFNNQNRSALHMHLSMQDAAGTNLFYEKGAQGNLSRTARSFIGGILRYARETSLVMASTYNSYKAYVVGQEAPIVRGWGLKNRSSMVRVPQAATPDSVRIELRSPDPAGNVYLQMAVLIGMGLQGIREGLDCPEPDMDANLDGGTRDRLWDERFLPSCMFEALVEAERSEFLPDFLGDVLYSHFMRVKTSEWEDFRVNVGPREHSTYLSA